MCHGCVGWLLPCERVFFTEECKKKWVGVRSPRSNCVWLPWAGYSSVQGWQRVAWASCGKTVRTKSSGATIPCWVAEPKLKWALGANTVATVIDYVIGLTKNPHRLVSQKDPSAHRRTPLTSHLKDMGFHYISIIIANSITYQCFIVFSISLYLLLCLKLEMRLEPSIRRCFYTFPRCRNPLLGAFTSHTPLEYQNFEIFLQH